MIAWILYYLILFFGAMAFVTSVILLTNAIFRVIGKTK